MTPPAATATNLLPSAEEAIEAQFVMGALVCVQTWANEDWTEAKPLRAAAASARYLLLNPSKQNRVSSIMINAGPTKLPNRASMAHCIFFSQMNPSFLSRPEAGGE